MFIRGLDEEELELLGRQAECAIEYAKVAYK